jgi:hypothetical protein
MTFGRALVLCNRVPMLPQRSRGFEELQPREWSRAGAPFHATGSYRSDEFAEDSYLDETQPRVGRSVFEWPVRKATNSNHCREAKRSSLKVTQLTSR